MTRTPPALDARVALGVAANIADHLCRTAYRYRGACRWMGMIQDGDDDSGQLEFTYETLGPELYGGTSGIALFLSEIYRRCGDLRFRAAAAGGIAHALARVHKVSPTYRLGFYLGSVGIAYAAARVGKLLERPDLRIRAAEILDTVLRDQDTAFLADVAAGAAGAIPALLLLAKWLERPDLAVRAQELGRGVIVAAQKGTDGWSWDGGVIGIESVRPLTGFAHGAAGIGWSLFELYDSTADTAFLEGAREAFRYENRWFQPDRDNWPDFRVFGQGDEPAPSCVTWCHGAPGIGLSRLRALSITGEEQYRRDAEAAVRTAKRELRDLAAESDFCLCHGQSGIGEFLLCAADVLGDPQAREMVLESAAKGAARFAALPNKWPCGVLRGSNPSLMTGLAGIGYFYLRLADPTLPSLLLMTPTG